MLRLNDLILLLVIFLSMLTGILIPRFGSLFQPYPLYLIVFLLFLSFLSIKVGAIRDIFRYQGGIVIWLCFLKLIVLPLCVYYLFTVLYPSYAVGALLLSAISTGVVAPFISLIRSRFLVRAYRRIWPGVPSKKRSHDVAGASRGA